MFVLLRVCVFVDVHMFNTIRSSVFQMYLLFDDNHLARSDEDRGRGRRNEIREHRLIDKMFCFIID
jgi:hypothetical protein